MPLTYKSASMADRFKDDRLSLNYHMELPERRNAILSFIVGDYIATASPVPSSAVAVESGLRVSSATIRNEMLVLCEEGYLLRPHVSAGAVPSEKGYRHFVESIDSHSQPPRDFAALLREQMSFAEEDVDAWVQIASLVIADLIGALSFITAPRLRSNGIKGIELLRLQDMLVMLVLIMQEARAYRQVIELERTVTDSELEHARNAVSQAVAGKDLHSVLSLRESTPERNGLERQVFDAALSLLQHRELAPGERYMSGYSHFISEPEMMAHPESGAMALSVLESDDAFATLISGVPNDGQPVVFIGSDNPRPELQEFSVIMCGYGDDDNARGIVGLVSPMRTAYNRAIPVVNFTAATLDALVNSDTSI